MMRLLFAPDSPRPAALMRIGLGLVLLWDVAGRWPYVVELYSTGGMPMPVFPGTFFHPPALPPLAAVALYALLLFALAAGMLGWQTRLSLAASFVLFTWFGLLDFAGTYKKYSVIAQHLFVLLLFTQCAGVWSVDAQCDPRAKRRTPLAPKWPRTLMMFLVSSVYVGAVVTKVRLPDFGTGDLLTFSLLDQRWGGNWLGMWLSTQPKLVVFLSFATTVFEMAAALLLWVPQCRRVMLVLAVVFHSSIGLLMHIGIFSPLMIVALLAFVREADLQWFGRRFGKWFSRLNLRSPPFRKTQASGSPSNASNNAGDENRSRRWVSWGLYGLVGVLWVSAGTTHQWLADYSGVFGAEEPRRWNVLNDETVEAIRSGEQPPPEDYFHRIDLGSRMGYRQVFGSTRHFKRGDTVYMMARLQQRHPRMLLHWVIISPAGDEKRFARVLFPSYSYAWFGFRMTDPTAEPGTYTVVLEADGEEVARRTFELHEEG